MSLAAIPNCPPTAAICVSSCIEAGDTFAMFLNCLAMFLNAASTSAPSPATSKVFLTAANCSSNLIAAAAPKPNAPANAAPKGSIDIAIVELIAIPACLLLLAINCMFLPTSRCAVFMAPLSKPALSFMSIKPAVLAIISSSYHS